MATICARIRFGFKSPRDTAASCRDSARLHSVSGFRSVPATPCRLPAKGDAPALPRIRARACRGRKTDCAAVFAPAKAAHENCLRGLALKLVCSAGSPGTSGGERSANAVVHSVAARLCAHCRAHWLGGGGLLQWTDRGSNRARDEVTSKTSCVRRLTIRRPHQQNRANDRNAVPCLAFAADIF